MLAEMTWVVLTGAFSQVAVMITSAATLSAAKPWIGRNLMILCPIVFMMRQPPVDVSSPIAAAQLMTTHHGTESSPVGASCPWP